MPSRRATLPASRSLTALKPIVIVLSCLGCPPAPATIESSTAVSEGSPLMPTVLPMSCRGLVTAGWLITAASGRSTMGRMPTMFSPRSRAMARSWMSRMAKLARPVSSRRIESVEADGAITCNLTPAAVSKWRASAV